MKSKLTIEDLIKEAEIFSSIISNTDIKKLYGVTDGKAVGTYIEHEFQEYLSKKYEDERGSAANGIDLPSEDINTDIKVTSIKQPQSSCPFKDAKQKVYGLGYNLLLFVYQKTDDWEKEVSRLTIVNCSFINSSRTADYQLTRLIRQILDNDAIEEEIIGCLLDRNLPADEITLNSLAAEIIKNPPIQGYLTISNALQWRLQYKRIVDLTDDVSGIIQIYKK